METRTIDPRTADLPAMIERGVLLHGHLGPYLVAGIRMGLLALRELGGTGYFGLRAESKAGHTTPLSCLNDGVQIGSGCTTGKGNLRIVGSGEPRVCFIAEDGRRLDIALRPAIVESLRGADVVAKAKDLQDAAEEALFAWTMSPP